MKPEAEAEGERWLRQAKHDLADAQYAQEGQRFHLTNYIRAAMRRAKCESPDIFRCPWLAWWDKRGEVMGGSGY